MAAAASFHHERRSSVSEFGLTITIGCLLVVTFALAADAICGDLRSPCMPTSFGRAGPGSRLDDDAACGPGAASQITVPGGAMTSQACRRRSTTSATCSDSRSQLRLARPSRATADTAEGARQHRAWRTPPWGWEYGEFGTLVGAAEPSHLFACEQLRWVYVTTAMTTRGLFRLSRIFSALVHCDGPGPCQANGSHFVLRWISSPVGGSQGSSGAGASGSLLTTARAAG